MHFWTLWQATGVPIADIFALTPQQAYFAVEEARWHGAPQCPYCKATGKVWPHPDPKRRAPRLQCGVCFRTFCVTVGTLFHGSHIPLRTWLLAIAHYATNPTISAAEFGRMVDIKRHATVSQMFSSIRGGYLIRPDDRGLMISILDLFGIEMTFLDEVYYNAV